MYRSPPKTSVGGTEKILKVLMISSASGPGLVFPKVCEGVILYRIIYFGQLPNQFQPDIAYTATVFTTLSCKLEKLSYG